MLGSAPKVGEVSQDALSPEQRGLLQQLISAFKPGATGAASLTSPDYSTLSPLESTSLAGLEQMAMNIATPSEAVKTSQGALKGIIDTGGSGFADYYKTNIADPVSRTFNEQILPGINRQYSNDFFSTDRGNALDRSQQRVLEALTQGAGQAMKDYRGETITAATALPGTELTEAQAGATDIQALIAALTGGATPRNVATTERNTQLAAILAALGIKTVDNTAVGLPGTPGLFGSFLGAAAKA